MASDDDYSDLTELESEDDVETTKKKSKSDDSGKGGYRIRNALKVPRATTYTAQALYDQIHSNDINLEPEYQRDVVWSEGKQIGVIDSIYRNFYIPPIIFAVNCHEDGSETKTCIDGKQRLTSIYKFMDGLIPHRDSETGEKHWYKDSAHAQPGRPKRKLLSPKYRKMFANKQIVCVEYQEINDAAEREIFQRVQLGMALTPAEKLQVIKTKRADFIRELQNTFLKEEGLLCGEALEWDTGRGSDFRCLAQSTYFMDSLNSTGAMKASTGIQQMEKWLTSEQGFTSAFQKNVQDGFKIFASMVQDDKYNHVFKKPSKVSPVEFIMMGVMIFVHKGKASMAQLAAGISTMRTDVRVTHVDIRMNNRVMKDMIDFITKWKPPTIPGDAGVPVGNTSISVGVKRKRPVKNDDDMDVDGEDGGDDDDDNDDGTYGSTKSKKKANNSSASTSNANAPKIKAEPTSTPLPPKPIPLPFHPPTDRLAALRRAKEAVAQKRMLQSQSQNPTATQNQSQSQSQSQAPSTSRNTGLATPNSANGQASPQMLPSPGLPFSFPSSSSINTQQQQQQRQQQRSSSSQLPLPNANGLGPTIRIPPLGTSSSTASSNSPLTGSAPTNRIPSSSSRSSVLPPPPSSGSSFTSDRDDRDSRSRDDDRGRDRRDSWDYDDRYRQPLPPRRR